jgi:hypothetical protein
VCKSRLPASASDDNIDVYNWSSVYNPNGPMAYNINMITNADQGILLSWDSFHESTEYSTRHTHMATISGASASVVDSSLHSVVPVLQLQDGSFVGTASDSNNPDEENRYMIAFDAGGGLRWAVSGYTPQIATADGGLIATSESGAAVVFDRNGSATGQMASLLTQSWLGYTYQTGSILQVLANLFPVATSFWPFAGANASGNFAAVRQEQYAQLDSCTNPNVHPQPACPGTKEAVFHGWYWLKQRLGDATRASALDTYVFQDSSGAQRRAFLTYLGLGAGPEFYDGPKSFVKLSDAQCGGPDGWTVEHYFGRSNGQGVCEMAAMTCRQDPTKPLRTFFEPRAISLDSQGGTDTNIALDFHEALHGFKQVDDPGLQSFLGCTEPVATGFGTDTRDITLFLQQFIGASPPPTEPLSCVEIERHHKPTNPNVCVR